MLMTKFCESPTEMLYDTMFSGCDNNGSGQKTPPWPIYYNSIETGYDIAEIRVPRIQLVYSVDIK